MHDAWLPACQLPAFISMQACRNVRPVFSAGLSGMAVAVACFCRSARATVDEPVHSSLVGRDGRRQRQPMTKGRACESERAACDILILACRWITLIVYIRLILAHVLTVLWHGVNRGWGGGQEIANWIRCRIT